MSNPSSTEGRAVTQALAWGWSSLFSLWTSRGEEGEKERMRESKVDLSMAKDWLEVCHFMRTTPLPDRKRNIARAPARGTNCFLAKPHLLDLRVEKAVLSHL